ncbi:MAG: Ni/Fe-hydrogenase cytochrome b subunit [Chloroflexi bacterium]|nr:Ni/Fe-hydrogenase cytochrome b subunit [Chloroflexota bacterium]
MSPTLEFLTIAFMFVARIGIPVLVLFGALYLLKRRFEPSGNGNGHSKVPWRVAISPVLISTGSLVLLAIIGVILYALVTNQFIDLLMTFRDVAVLAYLFILRVGVPLILLIGIGKWLERKFSPEIEPDRLPLSERVSVLKRVKLPNVSAGGILAITLVAALWAAFVGVTIGRFFFGLGSMTNMSDQFPWGLWLAFDMISGVALSAGGFVMAATVHIFNIKRFHPIVRPAILTAFLGYVLAIIGLLFDLGRWYNVWHAIFFWNVHSPLLEIAWCVILYTTVLGLEFSPIVFERFGWQRPLRLLRAVMMPLIILGILLSTLHQSTLGTLFLMFPEKLNPLWYSPLLPIFFFVSAVAVGLCMVILESNLSARFLGQGLESDLLAGLGKAASVVLFIYLALKVYDLMARGAAAYLTVPGLHSTLYWIEMFLGVLVPMVILATRRGRENPRVLLASSILVVSGVVLNRLDTTIFGWWTYTSGGPVYIPTLGELIGTLSLLSIGVVAFALITKNFPVFEEKAYAAAAPAE